MNTVVGLDGESVTVEAGDERVVLYATDEDGREVIVALGVDEAYELASYLMVGR